MLHISLLGLLLVLFNCRITQVSQVILSLYAIKINKLLFVCKKKNKPVSSFLLIFTMADLSSTFVYPTLQSNKLFVIKCIPCSAFMCACRL